MESQKVKIKIFNSLKGVWVFFLHPTFVCLSVVLQYLVGNYVQYMGVHLVPSMCQGLVMNLAF